jgi:hypothetical protein
MRWHVFPLLRIACSPPRLDLPFNRFETVQIRSAARLETGLEVLERANLASASRSWKASHASPLLIALSLVSTQLATQRDPPQRHRFSNWRGRRIGGTRVRAPKTRLKYEHVA